MCVLLVCVLSKINKRTFVLCCGNLSPSFLWFFEDELFSLWGFPFLSFLKVLCITRFQFCMSFALLSILIGSNLAGMLLLLLLLVLTGFDCVIFMILISHCQVRKEEGGKLNRRMVTISVKKGNATWRRK